MALLFLFVSLALGVSFLCSIMEAVLLSITPSFVVQFAERRPKLGGRLRAYKDEIDRPLAAILSLNTIAHTVGAAGAGAQAAAVYGEAYLGLISAILTLLILVVSEIVPKTLGAAYWRQLTPVVLWILRPTLAAMWPLVKLSEGITRIIDRRQRRFSVDRDELRALAEVGAREGVIGESESRILKNLFRFKQIRAKDIMTPRTVLFALEAEKTVNEVVAEYRELRFSRIPIFDTNRDQTRGFVLKSDILWEAVRGRGDTTLQELARPLAAVPDTITLMALFDRLTQERAHIALVLDEHGGTCGLVTLEDVVETLLGLEIVDEHDTTVDMQELARRQWSQRAERLGLLPEEGEAASKGTKSETR